MCDRFSNGAGRTCYIEFRTSESDNTGTIRIREHPEMNVTLPAELERRIREKIERGDYDNADALVEEAVHRLIEEDEVDLESLRARLQQADSEIDRGEGLEFDERTTKDLAAGIRERGMRRLAELQKPGLLG